MRVVEIPIDSSGKFAVQFPHRCVYCGQPGELQNKITVRAQGDTEDGRLINYSGQVPIAYCENHRELARRSRTLMVITFIVTFIVALGVTIFIGENLSITKLVVSMIVAVAAVGAVKLFYPPVSDLKSALGLRAYVDTIRSMLVLEFKNEEVATEVKRMNGGTSGGPAVAAS